MKMQKQIIGMLVEKDEETLREWLLSKLCKARRINDKMFYAKNLIAINCIEGLEYYYNYLTKVYTTYNDKEEIIDINSELAKIKHKDKIEILIKLLELTYDPNFKDSSFNGIYHNVSKSIINIGATNESMFNVTKEKLLAIFNNNQGCLHIGSINYLINDMENI